MPHNQPKGAYLLNSNHSKHQSVTLSMRSASCTQHLHKQSVFRLSAKSETVPGQIPSWRSLSPVTAIRFAEFKAIWLDSKADSTHASILKRDGFVVLSVTSGKWKNITLSAIYQIKNRNRKLKIRNRKLSLSHLSLVANYWCQFISEVML